MTRIKNNNIYLFISIIIAIAWLCFNAFNLIKLGVYLDSYYVKIICFNILMPYLITAILGTIFTIIGGYTSIKWLILAGAILECVSLFLGYTWGLGYIAAVAFGVIGFVKMLKC